MAEPIPVVSTTDRLCFTVFLAVVFHATLILGISFSLPDIINNNPVIEVTLAHNPAAEAPEKADFMAQENQIGGGELKEDALPSIVEPSEFLSNKIQEVTPETPPQSQPEKAEQLTAHVTSTQKSEDKVTDKQEDEVSKDPMKEISQEISLLERSLELASLDAKLDIREQLQTKDTRVLKVSSVSTLKTSHAYYVKQWVSKIQAIGKLNYPEEARRRKLYGELRLSVALLPNGTVKEIKILQSSGHKILDDAAIRIVRLAEPYAPFPPQLKRDYDVLEITRNWQFSKHGRGSVFSR
jgi:protein TonB